MATGVPKLDFSSMAVPKTIMAPNYAAPPQAAVTNAATKPQAALPSTVAQPQSAYLPPPLPPVPLVPNAVGKVINNKGPDLQYDTFGLSTGGKPFSMRCPAGQYVTTVRGRAGNEIDSLEIVCSAGFSQKTGGPGGNTVTESSCPTGYHAARAWSSTTAINGLQLVCDKQLVAKNGKGTQNEQRFSCPGGQVLVGLDGRSGALIDQVKPVCGPKPSGSKPTTTDCVPSGVWGDWGACNKSTGTQVRYQAIAQQPTNGGRACPMPYKGEGNVTYDAAAARYVDTRNCKVDCELGAATITDCVNGKKEKRRKVLVEPRNGGIECVKAFDSFVDMTDAFEAFVELNKETNEYVERIDCGAGAQTAAPVTAAVEPAEQVSPTTAEPAAKPGTPAAEPGQKQGTPPAAEPAAKQDTTSAAKPEAEQDTESKAEPAKQDSEEKKGGGSSSVGWWALGGVAACLLCIAILAFMYNWGPRTTGA